jgi:UDP-N-acetylglucosamine 4,6-dehydratase
VLSDLSARVADCVAGKTILVTGGAGTIGAAVAARLVGSEARAIRLLDNNEERAFYLELEHRQHPRVRVILGDVRDRTRMARALNGVDIVIHTAALKHVELGEHNPFEVVSTNLVALQQLIELSLEANVERFVFTSSDKAVNPTNVMGGSKFIGERLVTAAIGYRGLKRTLFCCTRFGNVLGSAGSVVPVFERQIAKGGPLTVTDPEMTRFFMTLSEAVDLVLASAACTRGGDIFVPKMHAVRLIDLAQAMIDLHAPGRHIPMQVVGLRPGEKHYEELITDHEMGRCLETDRLLIVLPYQKEWHSHEDGAPPRRLAEAYPDQPRRALQLYSSQSARPLDRAAVRQLLLSRTGPLG